MNYYNEFDPFAAAWLRELIHKGYLPEGEVDERSILDVRPVDLVGFKQHHFFAGIGGWPLALALAGWPEDRPVWTGSCPCQPFSAAGKGGGFDDERHLWPAFYWLIAQSKPDVIFGEQVEGPAGRAWLDLVSSDLEGSGYAFGASVFPAAGVGAPHGRHRTNWVADSVPSGRSKWRAGAGRGSFAWGGVSGVLADSDRKRLPIDAFLRQKPRDHFEVARRGEVDGLGDAIGERLEGYGGDGDGQRGRPLAAGPIAPSSVTSGVADPDEGQRGRLADGAGSVTDGQKSGRLQSHGEPEPGGSGGFVAHVGRPGAVDRPWRDADWLRCTDGKWRPVEPGTQPLASGLSARMVRLRGYGNAISPQQSAEFIKAYLDLGVIEL